MRAVVFTNHTPPSVDPEPGLQRARELGVDIVIAQGTGMDFGPHFLGSGEQFPVENFVANVRPYIRMCVELKIPFVFSVGIAGANVQLEACLEGFDELCAEEGYELDVAVIPGEIEREYLLGKLDAGVELEAAVEHPDLPSRLSRADVEASTTIVGQMGAEPIMAALASGADGVITGRALDVGLFIAPALRAGASKAIAGHFGKLLECGALILSPGNSGAPVWSEVDAEAESITIRALEDSVRCDARAVAAHSFYERRNPFREENPGGYLDLTEARYEQIDETTVRATGAKWGDTPYSVKIEGVAPLGYRSINVSGIRDPHYLSQLDGVIERVRSEITELPRFASLEPDRDYRITFTVYGRDAVLGEAETERENEHEVGVVIDAVAPTPELARELCYYAYIGLWIKPYPGRKTTAGNNAQRFSPPIIDVGQIYRWSVWHLLPLDDPHEPFPQSTVHFPRSNDGNA